jgi:LAGLIDADG endonuclease
MSGDNPTSGDNQQGRPRGSLTPDYVAGFIDGEGRFCISIRPNPSHRDPKRWMIAATFQAHQHRDNVEILEKLCAFFGSGTITSKGPNSSVMTYSVYGKHLESVIIPSFERHPMLSGKRHDFEKFAEGVRLIRAKVHRDPAGSRRSHSR